MLEQLEGKSIILGVLALDTADVESPATVAERIRRALPHKAPQELVVAPDCGMKYLPREAAYAKLQALVAGADAVRAEVGAAVRYEWGQRGNGLWARGQRPARART